MGKKGQVTVFIILGIILMVIFAAVLFIVNKSTTETLTYEQQLASESVPQEFVAVQQFVESCMYSVGKKGITILGQQGGYISPETLGEYSITDQTNAVGIDLDPLRVPYWHYNANDNKNPQVLINSLKPALYDEDDSYWSIEAQLARYLESNIQDCLGDFQVFDQQGYLVTQEYPEAEAQVHDNEVYFLLEMPLEVSKGDSDSNMENFVSDVDINLKQYYEIAEDITATQQEYTFLENHLINVLTLYAMPGGHFPPMLATTVDEINTDVWYTAQLQISLKEMLAAYVPMIRHQGSDNFYRYDFTAGDQSDELIPIYSQTYDNMILPLTIEDQTSLVTIDFNYFGWEPYLNINGGETTIEPQEASIESPLPLVNLDFTFQNYLNTYDISYPVLITIEDKDALNGEGFIFNIALESNIVNNEAIDTTYIQPEVSISNFESVVCNQEHLSDTLIKTIVIDAYTEEPISDVFFEFNVPEQDNCELGTTNSVGTIEEQYPVAIGGELNLKHEDYLDTSFILDTAYFSGDSAFVGYAVASQQTPVVELYPEKELEATVSFRPIKKCTSYIDQSECLSKWTQGNFDECQAEIIGEICVSDSQNIFGSDNMLNIYEMDSEGSASIHHTYLMTSGKKTVTDFQDAEVTTIVTMERISDVFGEIPLIMEDDHTALFTTSTDEPTATTTLYPGIYSLTAISSIDFEEAYVIPEDLRCSSKNEDYCESLDEVSFDQQMLGQLLLVEENTYIEITKEDLYSSDGIEIIVPAFDWQQIPESMEVDIERNVNGIKTINPTTINTRVIEDMQLVAQLNEISQESTVRSSLGLKWT